MWINIREIKNSFLFNFDFLYSLDYNYCFLLTKIEDIISFSLPNEDKCNDYFYGKRYYICG